MSFIAALNTSRMAYTATQPGTYHKEVTQPLTPSQAPMAHTSVSLSVNNAALQPFTKPAGALTPEARMAQSKAGACCPGKGKLNLWA